MDIARLIVGLVLAAAITYVIARVFAKGLIDGILSWFVRHADIVEKEK